MLNISLYPVQQIKWVKYCAQISDAFEDWKHKDFFFFFSRLIMLYNLKKKTEQVLTLLLITNIA